MADFITRGSIDGMDLSCVDQVRRPPFVVKVDAEKRPAE
jgi:hypothetical protein